MPNCEGIETIIAVAQTRGVVPNKGMPNCEGIETVMTTSKLAHPLANKGMPNCEGIIMLESLPIARLRFDLTALDDTEMPAYKGDMLRMALLWWLSEYWCAAADRCRNGCRYPDTCLFGRLIEPRLNSTWPLPMQRLIGATPPPAYALWDDQDRRRRLPAGSPWHFELTLAGALALRQIPAIVAAVQQGADRGMGRIQLRSQVRAATALLPGGERRLAAERPTADGAVLTWENFGLEDVAFGVAQANRLVATLAGPVRAIGIRYLSPVKIKEGGQWVERPEFGVVMRAVVRRLRILSLVHGAGEWPHQAYGLLLDLADAVRLEHAETHWTGFSRYSQRSGAQEVEGFLGQAWYGGADLRPLLPALWLGQWLHIGKSYVVGGGRYELTLLEGGKVGWDNQDQSGRVQFTSLPSFSAPAAHSDADTASSWSTAVSTGLSRPPMS